MRAGTYDRQVMVGVDKELLAIGMGNGGGAQHKGSMRGLVRRLGVLPVAETVQEACIDPSTLTGRTLYDHRDKGPLAGTVFALTRNPREFARPINIYSLLAEEGRNSLFRADEDIDAPTGLVTAWLDDGLVIVAHKTLFRDYLVEVEAALRRGALALIHPDIMQGPFLVISDRVPETLTIPTFKREADENLAGRYGPGCVFSVPIYQSDFRPLVPAIRF
ncbi:hypothetical protein [Methylobacterium aerolatum]|uniref:Uncharacterized protein n=1 Tax=Methylobacterium aerolatum TaxID=418708 RepID=A0ABU0HVI0_9HYPH|nr:hypothetical protein [Methylobacterium aerolatum]MDQ0446342.1 hypothetical protein [Methylobacterium aerolatum]GJD35684.1 hypothetical protein FMGBMHLM_2596 [Methylobacterium aerolatum]